MLDSRAVDLPTLARSYDRSADGYDDRFRALQREKYRAAASLLAAPPRSTCLDAGAGTALFAEWLAAPDQPFAHLRAELLACRWIALDASRGMLRRARARGALPLVADLAAPPFKPGRFALVVAFTSLLEAVPRELRALAALLAPGGRLVASFLAGEAPARSELEAWSGLRLLGAPLPAGQDVVLALQRSHG